MAVTREYGFERVGTKQEEQSKLRAIDANFDRLATILSGDINKRLSELERFVDIRGVKLSDVIYKVSDHRIVVYATSDQVVGGKTIIDWGGEDRKDNDFFEHSNSVSPDEITNKEYGDHLCTVKLNIDPDTADVRVRVLVQEPGGAATAYDRATAYV